MNELKQKLDLSVIVCTRNRAKQLAQVLQCLGYQEEINSLNWEIVIVDNASTDNTKEVSYAFTEGSNLKINYVYELNEGSSNARNTGIRSSKGELLLFLDDDILLPKDFISNALVGLRDFPDYDIFGFRILPDWQESKNPPFWLNFKKPFSYSQGVLAIHDLGVEPLEYPSRFAKCPISAAFICKRKVFDSIGVFREDLGIGAKKVGLHEDTEFFFFAILNKIKILYWPFATLYHTIKPERLTVEYFHSWYYRHGKSIYMVKNTGRIFGLKNKHLIGMEGRIANTMPKIFTTILLNTKLFNISLFLILKNIILFLLLPFSVPLILLNKTFLISALFAKNIGELVQAVKSRKVYRKTESNQALSFKIS